MYKTDYLGTAGALISATIRRAEIIAYDNLITEAGDLSRVSEIPQLQWAELHRVRHNMGEEEKEVDNG